MAAVSRLFPERRLGLVNIHTAAPGLGPEFGDGNLADGFAQQLRTDLLFWTVPALEREHAVSRVQGEYRGFSPGARQQRSMQAGHAPGHCGARAGPVPQKADILVDRCDRTDPISWLHCSGFNIRMWVIHGYRHRWVRVGLQAHGWRPP